MRGETGERWRKLCEQAAVEQGPKKTRRTHWRDQPLAGGKGTTVTAIGAARRDFLPASRWLTRDCGEILAVAF